MKRCARRSPEEGKRRDASKRLWKTPWPRCDGEQWRHGYVAQPAFVIKSSNPLAGRNGPQATYGHTHGRKLANTTMTSAALHAARIIRPLDCVNGRIEACTHQIAKVLSPTLFSSHGRLPHYCQSRNAHNRRRFLTRLYLKDRQVSAGV
jgi:hypothetical protein